MTFHDFITQYKKFENHFNNYYNNHVIIIDEIHRLSKNNVSPEKCQYTPIHKFLHNIKNKKVILLSGTPMSDLSNEISDIMNLLLPVNFQMPTDTEFDREFLKPDGSLINVDKLKQYFKGRVSYLKSSESNVNVEFVTNLSIESKTQPIKYLKLNYLNMDNYQHSTYNVNWLSENQVGEISEMYSEKNRACGLYQNSRQSILAIFPNGSFGSEGFNSYISTEKAKLRPGLDKNTSNVYKFKDIAIPNIDEPYKNSLKTWLNQDVKPDDSSEIKEQKKLQNLRKLSVKYADTIENLLKNSRFNKDNNKTCSSSFVYCSLVDGSGLIYFMLLLKEFGFESYNENTLNPTKKRRFIALTSKITTTNQIDILLKRFNEPKNCFGEYISVVIGSKIISEGITLKNIQNIFILNPFWNYTIIEQSIARGIRSGSHRDLINQQVTPNVKIFLYCTIYDNDSDNSIDNYMYHKSEIKDISIKHIEKVIKESCFDCALNYNRNYKNGVDYSRECEYSKCKYVCDDVLMTDLENAQFFYENYSELSESEIKNSINFFKQKSENTQHNAIFIRQNYDNDTNKLFYDDKFNLILKIINKIFLTNFVISYQNIKKLCNKYLHDKAISNHKYQTNNFINFKLPFSQKNISNNQAVNDDYSYFFDSDYMITFSDFDILTVLNYIINNNIALHCKYGLKCYLTYYDNFYFLINKLGIKNLPIQIYYTEFPKIDSINYFDKIVDNLNINNQPNLVNYLFSLVTPDSSSTSGTIENLHKQKLNIFNKLANDTKILLHHNSYLGKFILDNNVQYKKQNIIFNEKQKYMINWLCDLFNLYLHKIKLTDNTYVVSLFENCNVIPKYYKFNETELQWNEIIDDKDIMICKKYIDRLLNKLDNNKFGYYGILDFDKKIIYKIPSEDKKTKHHKGMECNSYQKSQLIEIMINLTDKIPIRPDDININIPSKKETLTSFIQKDKEGKKINLKSLSLDKIKMIWWYLYNSQQSSKTRICDDIFHILHKEKLIIGFNLTSKTITKK